MELKAHWGAFFDDVIASDSKHYFWLRSLSYLEYIGYRKIVKALEYQEVNQGVYHHLSDEIRHSYMLKELSQKAFHGRFRHVPLENPFIEIAENYFQDVDQAVNQWILDRDGHSRPFLCYMLVSYLIECRAMNIYPQYYAKLEEAPSKLIIQKIIKDEREHLSYLEEFLEDLPETPEFKDSSVWEFEAQRFDRYLHEFQHHAETPFPSSSDEKKVS